MRVKDKTDTSCVCVCVHLYLGPALHGNMCPKLPLDLRPNTNQLTHDGGKGSTYPTPTNLLTLSLSHIHPSIHTYIHTYIHIYKHNYTHRAHKNTRTHTHIHTRTYIFTCIRTHTHRLVQAQSLQMLPSTSACTFLGQLFPRRDGTPLHTHTYTHTRTHTHAHTPHTHARTHAHTHH